MGQILYPSAAIPDFALEVTRGRISGITALNKFGRAPDGVQTTATDIWDRTDATPTQQIWVAPTTARQHNIVSSSTSDDGDPVGAGARTLRIYGLTSWSSAEVSEDITLNGTSNVATVNGYVIIHRMQVLTKGATNVNVGTITATAVTDGTVTAAIRPGIGQTEMAIYGIPSTQSAYMTNFTATLNATGVTAVLVDIKLLVNPEPSAQLTNFLVKRTVGLQSSGTSRSQHVFEPYLKITGPAIIKLQGVASAADSDCTAGFDLYLVNN